MKDNNKSKYFRFGIIVFLWLLLIGGLSYAYFSTLFDNSEKTTTSVVTGKLNVDFITGQYINNSSMWPINDNEILDSSDKSVFSVTRSEDNTVDNVYYNIYIDDLVVNDQYKSPDIKWALYNSENPSSNTNPISSGSFENIGDSSSIQLNRERIFLPKNVTYTYSLFIWISNSTTENQNNLLNGHLEGKIKVTAVTE